MNKLHVIVMLLSALLFSSCTYPSPIPNSPSNLSNTAEQPDEDYVVDPKRNKYTISFDCRGGSDIQEQTVLENERAKKPETPSKEGFVFYDWYYRGLPYDFSLPVKEDISLEAIWLLSASDPLGTGGVEIEVILSNRSHEVIYKEIRAHYFNSDTATYYLLSDCCVVFPRTQSKHPVCADGIFYSGKPYLCKYMAGKSKEWETIELPHAMEAFINPYTLCDCLNLVELNIPDSVKTYYCYHGPGYYNGNQPFLCNLPKLKKLHFGYQFTSINLNVMPPADYIRPVRGQDYCNFPELVECNQPPMMDAFSLKYRFLDDAPKLEKISVDKNSVFGYDSFEGCVVSKDRRFLYSVPLGNSYFAGHSFASSGIKAIGDHAFFYNPFFTITDFTGLEFIDDIFNYYEFENIKKNKFWLPKGLIIAEGADLHLPDKNDPPMIFTDGNEEDVQRWINAYSKVYGKWSTNPWEEIYQYHLNATKEEYENY